VGTPPKGPFDYSHYELSFRDRQFNRALLAEYLPYFVGCRTVLDLACGSGIFLELLAEHGITGIGVERNPQVAAWVQQQGWAVVQQDVFEFLTHARDTYDGMFCSHFLEHLPFDGVLRLMELILPRLEPGGTLVVVVPNPESIRMQIFGFWRDPEHVRFYHPELLEAVCEHYGLHVIHTNWREPSFAIAPLPWEQSPPEDQGPGQERKRSWLRETVRAWYLQMLRRLRLAPAADLVALEERLRKDQAAFQQALVTWQERATWAINRMWAWPDNAVIVCRKQG
jgi:O-antigen chain-terminating methyltransferase